MREAVLRKMAAETPVLTVMIALCPGERYCIASVVHHSVAALMLWRWFHSDYHLCGDLSDSMGWRAVLPVWHHQFRHFPKGFPPPQKWIFGMATEVPERRDRGVVKVLLR